jgi:hypothetical protein
MRIKKSVKQKLHEKILVAAANITENSEANTDQTRGALTAKKWIQLTSPTSPGSSLRRCPKQRTIGPVE